jgi:hypothetical protein
MNKRFLPITIISWVYVAVGVVGFVHHARESNAQAVHQLEGIWVMLLSLLAIAAGVYMLRGRNWARWLAIAWMAIHVVVGGFHSLEQCVIHLVLLALFAYFLFRPEATAYFRAARTEAS